MDPRTELPTNLPAQPNSIVYEVAPDGSCTGGPGGSWRAFRELLARFKVLVVIGLVIDALTSKATFGFAQRVGIVVLGCSMFERSLLGFSRLRPVALTRATGPRLS